MELLYKKTKQKYLQTLEPKGNCQHQLIMCLAVGKPFAEVLEVAHKSMRAANINTHRLIGRLRNPAF